jgi:alpha-tubulin suppressor-like RCC1 family protein
MLSSVGCGYNHSVAVTGSGKVFVWGLSQDDELGVEELKGYSQTTPYELKIDSVHAQFQALHVSCGEAHTALVIKNTAVGELKLIHKEGFEYDLNSIFSSILEDMKQENMSLNKFHHERWGERKFLSREEVEQFFTERLAGHESIRHLDLIVDLLMQRGNRHELMYTEFRDQLYGYRLDDGLVMTWGVNDKHRLGRADDAKFVNFSDMSVTIRKVSCGASHTLALSTAGKLYAWGANTYGQLGDNSTEDRLEPVLIKIPGTIIKDLAAGGAHSLILDTLGRVWSWGQGEGGRLGHLNSALELRPKLIEDLPENILQVAAGSSHSGCFTTENVYTWGKGSYGRLGHGSLSDENLPKPIEFFRGRCMMKLCLSVFHSGVITVDGEIWMWGNSKNGRLGTAIATGENGLIPTKIGTGTLMSNVRMADLALGFKHGMAISNSGQIFVWGCGNDGKLGLGPKSVTQYNPTQIPNFSLGTGQFVSKKGRSERMPVSSTQVENVCLNDFNTAIITDAGDLIIAGSNESGQLGSGEDESDAPRPIVHDQSDFEWKPMERRMCKSEDAYDFAMVRFVPDSEETKKIVSLAGRGQHFIAITSLNEVYSWGDNSDGQLGVGVSKDTMCFEPQLLKNFRSLRIKQAACGSNFSAFLLDSGEIYMCGNSENGRLGLGPSMMEKDSRNQPLPRALRSLPTIKKIACGDSHTAAVDFGVNLWVWGSGMSGKLGLGSYDDIYEPMKVPVSCFEPKLGNEGVKSVACGDYHTIVLSGGCVYTAGLAKLAGHNTVNETDILTFQKLSRVALKINQISAGRDHSLAVTSTGQVYGWGRKTYHKLTTGPFTLRSDDPEIVLPCFILIEALVKKAFCGANHSAILTVDNSVWIWGATGRGRLGKGQPVLASVSVQTPARLVQLDSWFNKTRKKQAKLGRNDPGKALGEEDQSDKYAVQVKLKAEPHESTEESLLTDDIKVIFKIRNILQRYEEVRKVEASRVQLYNTIESCLIANIELTGNLPSSEFRKTIPPLISKNLQLYEFLVSSLQSHPCYLSLIIRENQAKPITETARIVKALYGEVEQNHRLLRNMMVLYKLVLRNIFNKVGFKNSMKTKTGDLSSALYSIVLFSQNLNESFFNVLFFNVIDILVKEGKKQPNHTEMINFKSLEDIENRGTALEDLYKQRKAKSKEIVRIVLDLIKGALTNEPQFRSKFTKGTTVLRLTDEIKFLYKEIVSVFNDVFADRASSMEGVKNINCKLVSLFMKQLIDFMKTPQKLVDTAPRDLEFVFTESNREGDPSQAREYYLEVIKSHSNNILNLVEALELVTVRETAEFDKFIEEVSSALVDVADIAMADLMLGDLLTHSLDSRNPRLSISISVLLNLHLMIFNSLDALREERGEDDPVFAVVEMLGDISPIVHRLRESETFDISVNLDLPTRWLLREKALQACPVCKTTLSYSLLKDKPEDLDVEFAVPTDWNCLNCGNAQDGWQVKCEECSAWRREFPESNVIKCFKPLHDLPILKQFSSLLMNLHDIPPNVNLPKYLEQVMISKQKGSALYLEIKFFLKSLRKESRALFDAEDDSSIDRTLLQLETQSKEDASYRAAHRGYIDSLMKMLLDIEEKMNMQILDFRRNVSPLINTTLDTVQQRGHSTPTFIPKAQGRVSVASLFKQGVLEDLDLAANIRKTTFFYFTEMDDGSFDVKVVLQEERRYLCVSRAPLEVKMMQFQITSEKLRSMRRTMNFRAKTSFQEDKVVFNVFHLVRLLGRMLGQS